MSNVIVLVVNSDNLTVAPLMGFQ